MTTKFFDEYDLYEIERKLERTYVKACEFFETNDLLIEKFDLALKMLENSTQPA